MNQDKKQIIEDIINALITINVFEYYNAHDKKLIGCTYKHDQLINAIIKHCSSLCLHDWSSDIIKDQTYLSVFESINKIAQNYTEDELRLIYSDMEDKHLTITNQFFSGVYKLSIFSVKSQLSGYRRDGKKGMIHAFNFCEYIEENLNDTIKLSNKQELDIVFFLQWFESNKTKFLTPKQLAFLENENITKTNKSIYRKRIFNNTIDAYKQAFNNCEDDRRNALESQIKTIEDILNAKDFESVYIKHRDKQYIIDAVTDDLEILRAFNLGYRNYDKVIRPLRVCLFKKLDELNLLLEEL